MKWHLACLAAGLISACGFAPLDLWPLTLLGVAFLLFAVERAPRLRTALARGWWFGFGQFVLGLNWIATAFTYQANMPAWVGWIGVVVLSLYLAIWPAAAGLAWRWSGGDRRRLVLLFAAAWIVTEFLRGTLMTGFPWNPLGVSLVTTPFAQVATFMGTYGLGGFAVLIAGALYILARREWAVGASAGVSLFAVWVSGLTAMMNAPEGAGAKVRLVQPGISQDVKHSVGYGPQLERFEQSGRTLAGGPTLLLWPEDGVPFILDEEPWEAEEIGGWLRPGDLLLTGGTKLEREGGLRAVGARNSVHVVDHAGQLVARYDKAHLVPFGEYLPFRSLLEPIGLARVVPGDIDFWEGPGPQTVDLPGFGRVGMQICYEIVFSGHVVDRTNRPDFIFNPSNDAWFGWWGPPQHFAQARLRAIEEGLPVVRATPTGVSGIIDARGNVVERVPPQEFGMIDLAVPPAAAPTLFAKFGNWLAFVFAALLIVPAAFTGRLKSGNKRANEPHT